MAGEDREAGDTSEPLLGGGNSNSDSDGKPHFGLMLLTCLFRLGFVVLYSIPCRPQNSSEGFTLQFEHILFLTAPGLYLFSTFIETYAKGINCVVSAASSIGIILLFAGGMIYAQLVEVSTDNVAGDTLWFLGGFILSLGHIFDAMIHYRKGWNLVAISKLFGFVGSLIFMAVGTIGPLENTAKFDYFSFRNFIFAGSLFYFVHVITLLIGQKVNVIFAWRD